MKSIAVIGAVAIIALAGCSSSTDQAEGSAASTTAPSAAPAASSAAPEAAPEAAPACDSPVKIGLNEPMSGPFGFYGQWVTNSVTVEANRINAAGGLLGCQIEVVTRDNGLDPAKVVGNTNELIGDSSVGLVMGPSFTAFYEAVSQSYEDGQKLNCQIAVNGTDSLKDKAFGFRINASSKLTADALVKYLAANNIKTLGAIYQNNGESATFDVELAAAGDKYGVKFVGSEYVDPTATSHAAQIGKLIEADAIFIDPQSNIAALTADAAGKAGYKGLLVGNNGLQGFTYVEGAGDAADGTIFASNYLGSYTDIPIADQPVAYGEHTQAVIDQFGVITGPKTGVDAIAGTQLAADCVVEWAAAVNAAGSFDNTAVAEAWRNLSLTQDEVPSGVGGGVNFQGGNESWVAPEQMTIYKWVKKDDGSWVVEELQAGSGS